MKKILYFVLVALLLGATSCVSKKKYLALETNHGQGMTRERQLNENLTQLKDKSEKQSLQINALMRDTTESGKALRDYRKMLYSNMTEQEKLSVMLKQKMDELQEREATINELQTMINAQNERVKALLNSVKEALLGFTSDELSVTQKNGKVYVAMSDKLLFQSGSAKVDPRGKEALGKLADVLKRQNDIDVNIEGHTDNVPIKTAQYKDNWDLSVVRATSVVRILIEDYDVSPLQIIPSGRSEYLPVSGNDSADGRSLNRRTEIIMAPKLDKLLEILQ